MKRVSVCVSASILVLASCKNRNFNSEVEATGQQNLLLATCKMNSEFPQELKLTGQTDAEGRFLSLEWRATSTTGHNFIFSAKVKRIERSLEMRTFVVTDINFDQATHPKPLVKLSSLQIQLLTGEPNMVTALDEGNRFESQKSNCQFSNSKAIDRHAIEVSRPMLYAECTQKDGEFSSQLKIFTVNRVSDGQVFKIRSEWTESTGHRESFWAKVEKVSRPTEPTDHRFFWDLNEITIDAENTFPLPTSALKTMKIEFLSSDPYQIKDSRGRNFKNCSITNH